MATAKPLVQTQDSAASTITDTTADMPTGTDAATGPAALAAAADPAPPAVPDYTTSPTWGRGGRFIINSAGDRVLAPDQE